MSIQMPSLQTVFGADHAHCLRNADNAFGPVVDQLCRTFDFTLSFEQTILSIIPDALFILSAPVCFYRLRHAPKSFLAPNWMGFFKALNAAILASLQLALLVLWTLSPHRTSASLPSAVVSLIASIALVYTSWVLHFRLLRPSSLVDLYLLVSIVCDAFQVRTLHLVTDTGALAPVALTALCVKTLLFVLECQSKHTLLREQYRDTLGAEETAGIFNRWFLTWLNPLFIAGYKKIIDNDDLPKIDTELSSEYLRDRMQETWNKRCKLTDPTFSALILMAL